MTKWDRVRGSFDRAHTDLFDSRYTAEFFNTSEGSYNPDSGDIEGQTRSSIGSVNVEIVPPAQDSTVDLQGTSFSWTTSIRLPLQIDEYGGYGNNWGQNWGSQRISELLIPLGEDNRKPTQVNITDKMDDTQTIYELHGYTVENGSGMVMCRLVEQ